MKSRDRNATGAARIRLRKASLDKDLNKLSHVEESARSSGLSLLSPGIALVFLALSAVLATTQIGGQSSVVILVVAAVLAGYMALNIGANDVANNVGPAVGSRALTLFGALIIAAVFESAGALLAGGDVVKTISKGIIDPNAVSSSQSFIAIMMSALCASAVWVNIATYVGAPVSTTHAVVGGVVGGGISAVGVSVVNWKIMSAIVASWVLSPVMGGVIAAIFLAFIKANIIYKDDKIAAAKLWVPALVAIMCSAFTAYLMIKGLGRIWKPSFEVVMVATVLVFGISFAVLRPLIRRQSENLENRNQSLRKLFQLPLICSAALLSFAHGANDVANAVGPLAGIVHSAETGIVAGAVRIPIWIMIIGAIGISMGLFLFGARVINTVCEQNTKMNHIRAFCVALSTAITFVIASSFGLPVSSTHIAVGAVFGVGFFREYFITHSRIRHGYLRRKGIRRTAEYKPIADRQELVRRKLVRRSHFNVIVAAWLVTVPAAAILSACLYQLLQSIM